MNVVDLSQTSLREVNSRFHQLPKDTNERLWQLTNVHGEHACAVGLTQPIEVHIHGHIGYYCAGMNQHATVVIHGQCGVGVAENMMSGEVRVMGCGISMKGIDIVVGGSVGAMSAFMGQAGSLVVLGDTGANLGDSLYEARLYVRGKVESLGADCVPKQMTPHHVAKLGRLLKRAGVDADPKDFKRYGSARKLYNFHVDNVDAY
jgi:methylamine---glutamate N-methyltransferase subunit B